MNLNKKIACLIILFLNACGREDTNNQEVINSNAIQAKALESEIMVLQGYLDFRNLIQEKNYKSYNGLEFFLTNDSAQSYNLEPSESISREELIKFDDHEVEIKGYLYHAPAPHPISSYPIDKNGNPEKTSARIKVTEIKNIRNFNITGDNNAVFKDQFLVIKDTPYYVNGPQVAEENPIGNFFEKGTKVKKINDKYIGSYIYVESESGEKGAVAIRDLKPIKDNE